MKSRQQQPFQWAVPHDYPIDDLERVIPALQEANFLLPSFLPPEVGLYHPFGYVYARQEGINTIILPDRNIASRMAQLAQGRKTVNDKQLRHCAALLSFAHLLDIQFEPGIAFHELAHRAGNVEAEQELGWFRAADNAPSQDMLNVALGRCDGVSRTYAPHPVHLPDMARPIKRWNRNYIAALKILELDYAKGKALDKMLHLLDWMRDDFVFAGPAVMLACVYLGTHSPSRKNVFKDKNSKDRTAAIAGVRNAAWDITHLSEFIRLVNQDPDQLQSQYLFASFDSHLRLTTRLLLEIAKVGYGADQIAEQLTHWWSAKDAARIAHEIKAHLLRINCASHIPRTSDDPDFIPRMIEAGERRITEL
jgi:hypothetical protein